MEFDRDLVEWEPRDAANPHNWSTRKKLFISLVLNTLPFVVNVSAGVLSGSSTQLAEDFHVPRTTVVLIVTMFLLVWNRKPNDYDLGKANGVVQLIGVCSRSFDVWTSF